MRCGAALAAFLLGQAVLAQTTAESARAAMEQPLQSAEVTAWQIRRYVVKEVPKLAVPARAEDWRAEAQRLRERVLREVVYHGWPREWVEAPPRFEDLGNAGAGPGYRLRKLRYEIVPGFHSAALLYEPEHLRAGMPAILNVNGHEADGKAMEYIQKRSINQARQGILALNLEWIGMGELAHPENVHWNEAYLDFAGANGLGLFYLAMRRGLDYLWQHPQVDRARIGITGLSGGGWQAIVLGALDERILAALPNAGYLSGMSLGGAEWVGDNEQSATDFNAVLDYMHLTAMRAPRPTLLIYNETDSCCFRAPRMKPFLYDQVRPIFRLFGAEDRFSWYANTDPGDHNYQLDNRLHSYAFFARYFQLGAAPAEIPAEAELRTSEQLAVGLPVDNLTILGLARRLAGEIRRPAVPPEPTARSTWAAGERHKLEGLVKYRRVDVESAWPVANSWGGGLKTIGYRFDFDNALSASGTWLKATATRDNAPWTIVLDDEGRKAAGAAISERVNRGEQVLAADLLFTGDAAPPTYYYPVYDRMLATMGDRSLGLEAAQLIALARWIGTSSGHAAGRLEARGRRQQAVALVAAALEPGLFRAVTVRDGLRSWRQVFDEPVDYLKAPEIFCLDLYREFDIERLEMVGARVQP
ncbi:MAG TPA: acetylxylan esterase [Bryobacteraceae bacterium]|nr:acetylxylan esterase [Bryobacteraceae bacterium]